MGGGAYLRGSQPRPEGLPNSHVELRPTVYCTILALSIRRPSEYSRVARRQDAGDLFVRQ